MTKLTDLEAIILSGAAKRDTGSRCCQSNANHSPHDAFRSLSRTA
jgi:hypothetical protein